RRGLGRRLSVTDAKRIVPLNAESPSPRGRYVLYWMQAYQRADFNPALDHAIERANELRVPVVAYHGLRCDYPYASDRIHAFVLEGARARREGLEAGGIRYVFHLERSRGPRRRRIALDLAASAALVVTDLFPTFVVPAHNAALARRARVAVTAVDGNGVVPL